MKKINKKLLVFGMILLMAVVLPLISVQKIESGPIYGDYIRKGYICDHTGAPIKGASILVETTKSNRRIATAYTDSQGYYYLKAIAGYYETTTVRILVRKSGYEVQYISEELKPGTGVRNFYIAPIGVKKIAAFFYDSKVADNSKMNSLGNQLIKEEGFEKVFYYKDPKNCEEKIENEIDQNEDEDTFVFLYFNGHGKYTNSNSRITMRVEEHWFWGKFYETFYYCYSDDLDEALDTYLESKNIFILIESCYSGGFVDDCKGPGRYVISTTDRDNVAYSDGGFPSIGIFTKAFFSKIHSYSTDSEAFCHATFVARNEHSNQHPMGSDQCAYTWFRFWWLSSL